VTKQHFSITSSHEQIIQIIFDDHFMKNPADKVELLINELIADSTLILYTFIYYIL